MSIVEIIYTPKQKVVPNIVDVILRYKVYDRVRGKKQTEIYRPIDKWESKFTDNIEFIRLHRALTDRMMLFEIESVTKGIGKPEWGAPEGETLIIKLGKKICDTK